MTNIDRAVRLIKLYGTRTGSPRDVALELAAAQHARAQSPQTNITTRHKRKQAPF